MITKEESQQKYHVVKWEEHEPDGSKKNASFELKENYWRYLGRNWWWFFLLFIAKAQDDVQEIGFLRLLFIGIPIILIIVWFNWSLWGVNYKKEKNIRSLVVKLIKDGLLVERSENRLTKKIYKILKKVDSHEDLLREIDKNKSEPEVFTVLGVIERLCFGRK